MSKLRDEILPGIRSLPFRAHVIFYAIELARIVIERVLHGYGS